MLDALWNADAAWRVGHAVLVLAIAGGLGAALGIARPIRRQTVPRSAHLIQAQILLAIVGAMIVVVVAESLARAFAIVGVASLVRYRSRIEDPKEAGVMLVALTLGLAAGAGLFLFAFVGCAFVVGLLWVLESFEPSAKSRFDLTIQAKDAEKLQPEIEHALHHKGVAFELRGSSHDELRYEVTIPYHQQIRKLTRLLRDLAGQHGMQVEWEIKKYETVLP